MTFPNVTPEQRLSSTVLSKRQIREIDTIAISQFGMNSLVLMENAGIHCAMWIAKRLLTPIPTVVLCGPGNNGGDGLVITRHLRNWGWDCQALLLGPPEKFSSDTLQQSQILGQGRDSGLTIVNSQRIDTVRDCVMKSGLIIDAMLGTGATGDPRPPYAEWINLANASAAFRLAIDIPTGVDADTGVCGNPTFRADATLTFVALKSSMTNPKSSLLYGNLQVLPIGIPEKLILQVLSGSVSNTDSPDERA